MTDELAARVKGYLKRLCEEYPDRHVGGPGNRAATALFAEKASAYGFDVEIAELECLEWERGESELTATGETFALHTGPYSPSLSATAKLAAASTVGELEAGSFGGDILLLTGELVAEQLMPKNFVFYNPDSHRRIVSVLEAQGPVAVIAATGRNPDLAGGSYPFPLIEDGDFDIPSAYLTDAEGERLLAYVGEQVSLRIDSRRVPALAQHVVARKGGRTHGGGAGGRRIVLFAHIDSKDGTPGALDNASGVAALLGAAELLGEYDGDCAVELVPLNGEDYYAATGQMRYIADNAGRWQEIVLGLNVDGAGFVGQQQAVSLYGVPAPVAAVVLDAAGRYGLVEGPQWPQGDHSILTAANVPAVAVTSENAFFIASTLAHTPEDTPDHVDPTAVAQVSRFLADIVRAVAGM